MEQKDVPGSSYIFPALETRHFSEEDWSFLWENDNKKWVPAVLIATKMLLLCGFLSGQPEVREYACAYMCRHTYMVTPISVPIFV